MLESAHLTTAEGLCILIFGMNVSAAIRNIVGKINVWHLVAKFGTKCYSNKLNSSVLYSMSPWFLSFVESLIMKERVQRWDNCGRRHRHSNIQPQHQRTFHPPSYISATSVYRCARPWHRIQVPWSLHPSSVYSLLHTITFSKFWKVKKKWRVYDLWAYILGLEIFNFECCNEFVLVWQSLQDHSVNAIAVRKLLMTSTFMTRDSLNLANIHQIQKEK